MKAPDGTTRVHDDEQPPLRRVNVPLREGEPMLIDLAGYGYTGYGHGQTILDLLAAHDARKAQT